MRFTIVDDRGSISFIGPVEALPALVRACGSNPKSLEAFLQAAEPYYAGLADSVGNGLAIFDERNSPASTDAIHKALAFCEPYQQPVFRVVDDLTRETSLQPVKAGAVIFNMVARRIIQLQNSYLDITKAGWAQIHDGAGATGRRYVYRVPRQWAVVP